MSERTLNLYGDHLVETTGMHGADIASQRLDELDKAALRNLLSLPDLSRFGCLDLGCGFGLQGVRFAMLGADAYLFDLLPRSALVKNLQENTDFSIAYASADLRLITAAELPKRIDLAFSQRFIHYLTFFEAVRLIRLVGDCMQPDSMFYISASGLESELGENYKGLHTDIRSRFSPLDDLMQSKHDIREPVCLYTQDELTELMTSSGFAKQTTWKSEFGNVKGVFLKSN